MWKLLGSKTVWGGILMFAPNLIQAVIAKDWMGAAHAAGGIIGVAGGRDLVDKAAQVINAANPRSSTFGN